MNQESKELNVLLSITSLFDMECSIENYLQGFIDIICANMSWPIGHIYLVADNAIAPSSICYKNIADEYQEFVELANKISFEERDYIPDRILELEQSIWIDSIKLPNELPTNTKIVDLQLQAAFVAPIFVNNNIYAIAEFFMTQDTQKDQHLINIVDGAAKQVGLLIQFISYKQEIEIKNQQLSDTVDQLQAAQLTALHAEKMASIGQLAAGVAHEINNPIGFVTGNIDIIGEYAEIFKQSIKLLKQITTVDIPNNLVKEINDYLVDEDIDFVTKDIDSLLPSTKSGLHRVKDIVNSLKSFARIDSANNVEDTDINCCIESTLQIAMNELKYHCEIEKSLATLPQISINAGQINQVILNLLVNAGQSMEENGLIKIGTYIDEGYVVIKIADNGKGIPPEMLDKIFDPFFTTKAVGSGTGLGLSVSYGIVERHKGKILVESEVGKGTTFAVLLPIGSDNCSTN